MPNFPSNVQWTKTNLIEQLCHLAANAHVATAAAKSVIAASGEIDAITLIELRRNHLRMKKIIVHLRDNYASELAAMIADEFRVYKIHKGDITSGDSYSVGGDINEVLASLNGTIAQAKTMLDSATKLQQSTTGDSDLDAGIENFVWSRVSEPAFGVLDASGVNALEAACDAVLVAIADPAETPIPTIR